MNLGYFHYFEYLSLVASLFYYRGLKAYSLQLMAPLLLIVCVIETVAAYYSELGLPSVQGVNNLYILISPFFYFVIFYKMIRPSGKFAIAYQVIALLTIAFIIYDLLDSDFFKFINTPTIVVSLTEHVILSLLVLFKLFSNESREVVLMKEPYFWIAMAILIFSLVTIVTMGLHPIIYKNKVTIFGKSAYRVIMPMVCVVMYSCYSYAFFLTSRAVNKTLVPDAGIK
jgi:hypothetical protein